MEAGYDYTLMGGRPQGNAKYLPALFVAVLEGVLVISGLAYYGFSSDARADQAATQVAGMEAVVGSSVGDGGTGATSGSVKYTRYLSPASADVIAGQQLYPAGFADAEYWVNPLGYEE